MNVLPRGNILNLERLYLQGFSNRAASLEAGVAKKTVIRYFSRFHDSLGPVICGCGKDSDHQGWCWYRVSRSPRRQEVIKSWTRRASFRNNKTIGTIWRPDFDIDSLHLLRGIRCSIKGCVFGAKPENKLCDYHQEILALELSEEPGTLEWKDLHDSVDGSSTLAVVLPYQIDNLYETDRFGTIKTKSDLEKQADEILLAAVSV